MQWECSRRYSEFYALYKVIKKPAKIKGDFPKKVYSLFQQSTDPQVVNERIVKLNAFLKELLQTVKQTKHPLLVSSLVNFIKMEGTFLES